MVVNNQLISWVVGKTGDAPNPSPTKATGAIWSRIEATLMKSAAIKILDAIEINGLKGKILSLNHDDFCFMGDPLFYQTTHAIMGESFTNVAPLTGLKAFCTLTETYQHTNGQLFTTWADK
jgi:hypothetical protein